VERALQTRRHYARPSMATGGIATVIMVMMVALVLVHTWA